MVPTEGNVNASFNQSAEYTKLNPLGKIPTFVGANGFVLTEAIAIAIYGMYTQLQFYVYIAHITMMNVFIFQLSLTEQYC